RSRSICTRPGTSAGCHCSTPSWPLSLSARNVQPECSGVEEGGDASAERNEIPMKRVTMTTRRRGLRAFISCSWAAESSRRIILAPAPLGLKIPPRKPIFLSDPPIISAVALYMGINYLATVRAGGHPVVWQRRRALDGKRFGEFHNDIYGSS